MANEKTEIVIDRNDWQGMRTAVIAELKSSKIATLILSVQLNYIDGMMAKLPIVKLDIDDEKDKVSGIG